ncbi:MAG: hypothetical protein NW220_11590 [Leptolyngbyaceae cyanobacterium bins.349]|nr:hypothetical protein [Leptolyngbyaceae cyanobacterium bins.349]
MPIQKISLDALQKVRQHIKSALSLPDSENKPRSPNALVEEDLPEPDCLGDLGSLFSLGGPEEFTSQAPNVKGDWFISSMNPGAALMKLPGIHLKPGLRLVTYLHRTATDGSGVTWAVPETLSTTANLERALAQNPDANHPPQPDAALADVMEAIAGDRSPLSFVIASLLRRELREFGTLGKFCHWTHHRLIESIPTQVQWEWRVKPPQDLAPKVLVYPDQKVAIEFFTCRVTAPVAIFQHVDQYPPNQYRAVSTDRAIAVPLRANPPATNQKQAQ